MKIIWLILFPLSLAACAMQPVIDSNGPIPREGCSVARGGTAQPPPAPCSYQFTLFRDSYMLADSYALEVAKGSRTNTDPAVQAAYTQMAVNGFGLADANCADFFRDAGSGQSAAVLARDLVAAVGTLATAIAAASSAPAGLTTGFSIATATAYNGLDIYQRDFLFGADNIDSVRTLVERALAAHTTSIIDATEKTPWRSFGEVASSIMDHQSICFPPSILLLTRNAIKNATIEAVASGGKKFSVSVPISATPVVVQGAASSQGAVVASTRPPVVVPTVAPGTVLPPALAQRRLVLLKFVRGLAVGLKGEDLAGSQLRKVAVALHAPISDDVGEQRDNVVAFILEHVRSDKDMDNIAKELVGAGISQPF